MNESKRLTHYMTVSPITFRHNLRLPTATAHAQARRVRRDLLVLHHFFPLLQGTIAPRALSTCLWASGESCEATKKYERPVPSTRRPSLASLFDVGLLVVSRPILLTVRPRRARINLGFSCPAALGRQPNENFCPILCNAVSFHDYEISVCPTAR